MAWNFNDNDKLCTVTVTPPDDIVVRTKLSVLDGLFYMLCLFGIIFFSLMLIY